MFNRQNKLILSSVNSSFHIINITTIHTKTARPNFKFNNLQMKKLILFSSITVPLTCLVPTAGLQSSVSPAPAACQPHQASSSTHQTESLLLSTFLAGQTRVIASLDRSAHSLTTDDPALPAFAADCSLLKT